MPSVLVTGANRGIGLEFARQYAADGWRVLGTAREPDRAKSLVALGRRVSVHGLDVSDPASIEALARALGAEPIDLLVNNAGIYGPRGMGLGSMDYEAWDRVLRVNAMGPLALAERLVENVAGSERKRIVAVTSAMGSIARNTGGGSYAYRSSKAALNMAMKCLAIDTAARGITVAVLHPGWVRTDMGGESAPVSVEESVSGMRRVIDRLGPGDSGKFFGYDGAELPW